MEIFHCHVDPVTLTSWEHHEVPKECPYKLEALMEADGGKDRARH
jgi:hypothetical protein